MERHRASLFWLSRPFFADTELDRRNLTNEVDDLVQRRTNEVVIQTQASHDLFRDVACKREPQIRPKNVETRHSQEEQLSPIAEIADTRVLAQETLL